MKRSQDDILINKTTQVVKLSAALRQTQQPMATRVWEAV